MAASGGKGRVETALSETFGDITALVLMYPPRDEDEKYIMLPFFWVPEETIPQLDRPSRAKPMRTPRKFRQRSLRLSRLLFRMVWLR